MNRMDCRFRRLRKGGCLLLRLLLLLLLDQRLRSRLKDLCRWKRLRLKRPSRRRQDWVMRDHSGRQADGNGTGRRRMGCRHTHWWGYNSRQYYRMDGTRLNWNTGRGGLQICWRRPSRRHHSRCCATSAGRGRQAGLRQPGYRLGLLLRLLQAARQRRSNILLRLLNWRCKRRRLGANRYP